MSMNIGVIGTGYVGLVAGVCLAETGHTVWCADQDRRKVEALKLGRCPIYEPNLQEMLLRQLVSGRLRFTEDSGTAVRQAEVVVIAVGTPSREDGSTELSAIEEVAEQVGRNLTEYKVIVTKSTVPPGTTERIKRIIAEQLCIRHVDAEFDVASNPEFQKEGHAVEDFMNPDRIVVGVEIDRCLSRLKQLFEPWIVRGTPFLAMDIRTSEMTKYAANAMLATRISFMNEMASLCDAVGADIEGIKTAIGLDPRIGKYFLSAGIGYGGSCFPKDVRSLIRTADDLSVPTPLLQATDRVNTAQQRLFVSDIVHLYGRDLAGCRIAVWGLAFKPNTDDIREAPALETIRSLRELGALIHTHDPAAVANARQALGEDRVCYFDDPYEALTGADALLLFTEWDVYRNADLQRVKQCLKQPVVLDGRNIFNKEEMDRIGLLYRPIGRGSPIVGQE
jgi:UDPglucose 6-dehydrogenase